MPKTFNGIWCEKKVLCPQCLVPSGPIINYGADQQGFWFKGRCPHCSAVIKWYRKTDLSVSEATWAAGIQLSLFDEKEKSAGKKKARLGRMKRKNG
ncbi:hypothetical protein [Candidatus Formimonas warabiya]|uniref:Uncharacterized protein n=1 Tax=Formimonas warabiya TaxID=1761012 RepID=A0A3G1KXM2_FORW1|nr:hypothetical protein [Candidatus Formimonas warabiya]ATW27273.1 hypothetical protein DCMF_23205 [Candidatus Formimonas warabiya]